MKPQEVIHSNNPNNILSEIMMRIHSDGPVNQQDLETLSYLKHFHPSVFSQEEKKLMYLLGLFYKIEEPTDLLSFSYATFANAIFEETSQMFTPVQASIRNNILCNKYFSFSAPTSAGKSFLLRELIKDETKDIIIVVPSRALIAEYIFAVRELVGDRKDILVLQFIDDVNKTKTSRKIFIVTPERASEIFKEPGRFNPSLFLYDEAQISEEKIRGVSFDAFVRRADRIFPSAKKVFAHPFIENPEAQLKKHVLSEDADAIAYQQNTVGKICLEYNKSKSSYKCFSPFIKDAHLKDNKLAFPVDIIKEKLLGGGSVLIYVTKASIYDKSFYKEFEYYISLCDLITNPIAIEIIDEIKELIGANNRKSDLVDLMKRGVVIHHGSVPLNIRFLIEKFTNANFAKICFATSTLIQGVNMPFDVVFVDNWRFEGEKEEKALALKNLIGRAGRSKLKNKNFEYGYVVVKNAKQFVELFNRPSRLSETSLLDKNPDAVATDLSEFIEAVKNNNLNDDYNLPNIKVARLTSVDAVNLVAVVLNFLFKDNQIMSGSVYQELSNTKKKILKEALAGIYELSLGRSLYVGEKTVLSASITILLQEIQGKTFKELLGLRYSYLTDQRRQRELRGLVRSREITFEECEQEIENISIGYSPIPYSLPNSNLKKRLPSRFNNSRMKDFNYDLLVYDTYDFLDKVISFSLMDIFIAAFDQFYLQTGDERANEMVKYLKYGTDDEKEIWLMRYGFSIEEAELIKTCVQSVSADEIIFLSNIYEQQNAALKKLVERYL